MDSKWLLCGSVCMSARIHMMTLRMAARYGAFNCVWKENWTTNDRCAKMRRKKWKLWNQQLFSYAVSISRCSHIHIAPRKLSWTFYSTSFKVKQTKIKHNIIKWHIKVFSLHWLLFFSSGFGGFFFAPTNVSNLYTFKISEWWFF